MSATADYRRLLAWAKSEQALEYAQGFERGLRRRHHGAAFGTEEEHAAWMKVPNQHTDPLQAEWMRGYRDAFAALEPDPEGLRPRSGSRTRKTVPLIISVAPELAARVDAAAAADGSSRSAWVRAAIEAKLGGSQ